MSDDTTSFEIGPLIVETDASSVAAFNAALTDPPAGDRIAYTFPASWLTQPQISSAVLSRLPPQKTLVMDFQSIRYRQKLQRDRRYSLRIVLTPNVKRPSNLSLRATVDDAQGRSVLDMDSGLIVIDAFSSGQSQ